MSEACTIRGLFGRRLCNFQPRYDSVLNNLANRVMSVKGAGMDALEQMLKDKLYIRDVCTACGKTVERKP